MPGVRVSQHFSIVIRKEALEQHKVPLTKLLQIMETSKPFDEDEFLLSFGPHFGQEAASEFIRRLEGLGFVYGDDFLEFEDILPRWCQIYIALGVE